MPRYIMDAEENGNGDEAAEWATKVYYKLKLLEKKDDRE